MSQADEEKILDDYILNVLERRRGTRTDMYDILTMTAIDDKWGGDTPRLLGNSQTCHKFLQEAIERLRLRKLIMVEISQDGSHKFLLLTDPLEQFTRQVHETQ